MRLSQLLPGRRPVALLLRNVQESSFEITLRSTNHQRGGVINDLLLCGLDEPSRPAARVLSALNCCPAARMDRPLGLVVGLLTSLRTPVLAVLSSSARRW